MGTGEPGTSASKVAGGEPTHKERSAPSLPGPGEECWILETEVSPFHCLYQDALFFHTQARLALSKSVPESSRMSRAAVLCYVAAAEAIVHQAAIELARPDLAELLANPERPLPLDDVWRLLPAVVAPSNSGGHANLANQPPWPQFAELLALRNSWAYPGNAANRKAYYRAPSQTSAYEPLLAYQVPSGLVLSGECLNFPRTGLPRDPYALRPEHVDTIRGILDAAVEALDRRMNGLLTRDNRHKREPVRMVYPRED